MKTIIFILIIGTLTCYSQLSNYDTERIANAIYKVEGGTNTHYPYGIKSVVTTNPRRVCLNTIKNNYTRWLNQTNETDFIVFLADRYCPKTADPKGNANWKRNIKKILGPTFHVDKPTSFR